MSASEVSSALDGYAKVKKKADVYLFDTRMKLFNTEYVNKSRGFIFKKKYTMNDMIEDLEKSGNDADYCLFENHMSNNYRGTYSRIYIPTNKDGGGYYMSLRYLDAELLLRKSIDNLNMNIECNGRYLDFVNEFKNS